MAACHATTRLEADGVSWFNSLMEGSWRRLGRVLLSISQLQRLCRDAQGRSVAGVQLNGSRHGDKTVAGLSVVKASAPIQSLIRGVKDHAMMRTSSV